MRAALPGYSKTQFIKTRDSKRYLSLITVKPVLRGHLWDKGKVVFSDRWHLKRGSIHMIFFMTGQDKIWSFNTSDCLIDVTTWTVWYI